MESKHGCDDPRIRKRSEASEHSKHGFNLNNNLRMHRMRHWSTFEAPHTVHTKANDTSVDPKQPIYFEIKKPPWISVVWVVIACCICSKHDPCIYAARNAQPQRGKIFATQKSFDGASEASGVFLSAAKQISTERAKRAESY